MQPNLAVTVAFFELVLCIALPGPLAQIIRMLADAATSVALFTIRAVMWRAGQHAHTRTPIAQYLPVALFKLAIHPALVLGVGMLAHAAGLRVSTFVLTVLAERYGAYNGRVARIIMVSTVLAFGSFSLLAWWLGAAAAGG